MSEILDSMGQPLQSGPPTSNRRAKWDIEARNLGPRAIKFWRQKKADLFREAESVLDKARLEGRDFSEGEHKWYEQTKSDIEYTQGVIAQMESAERESTAKAGLFPTGGGSQPGGFSVPGAPRHDDGNNLRLLQREPFRGRHFGELFGAVQHDSPFGSFNEFLSIIGRNQYDPRLTMNAAAAGMSEGIMSEGGFLVPVEYASRLLDSALEQSVLWGRVRVEPMTSSTKVVSTFANEDTSGGKPFGLTLQWPAEGGTFTESKALTRAITLNAKKAGVYVPFTRELSDDGGANFSTQLMDATGSALAWGIDDAVLNGNGAGKPIGAINAASTLTVNKEAGQVAGSFLFENAVNMYARMHPACVPNSIWLASPSTLPALLSMTVGTGASGVWYPALKETTGTYSLLGRPLFLTEKCAALGTKGDVILLDPTQYVLGLRRGITVALSEHIKFASDEIVLKVTVRLDGMPAWAKAFTPKSGPTTSWAVVLQTR